VMLAGGRRRGLLPAGGGFLGAFISDGFRYIMYESGELQHN
jgi:hypothetical protein